jgi:putative flippase GtrA
VPAAVAVVATRPPLATRVARFAGVSVISVVITQGLLVLFNGVLGWPGWIANVLAVGIAAGPAYLLNRRWVWAKFGPHSVSREVVPFWAYTFLGLLVSTVAVAIADEVWGTTLAVQMANIAAFGALWVGKFVLLDRVLFRHEPWIQS